MKITVTYFNGSITQLIDETAGGGDADEIRATKTTLELDETRGLVCRPRVQTWQDGEWRLPKGIAGYVEDIATLGSHKDEYVLLSPLELNGAQSVVVDGKLAYERKGDALVPASSASMSDQGGDTMCGDFWRANHPNASERLEKLEQQVDAELEA